MAKAARQHAKHRYEEPIHGIGHDLSTVAKLLEGQVAKGRGRQLRRHFEPPAASIHLFLRPYCHVSWDFTSFADLTTPLPSFLGPSRLLRSPGSSPDTPPAGHPPGATPCSQASGRLMPMLLLQQGLSRARGLLELQDLHTLSRKHKKTMRIPMDLAPGTPGRPLHPPSEAFHWALWSAKLPVSRAPRALPDMYFEDDPRWALGSIGFKLA